VRAGIATRKVTSPSGTTWRIHRTWARGYAPSFAGKLRGAWNVTPGDFVNQLGGTGFDGADSLVPVLVVIVALVLAVFVLVPLLLFGLELIIVGLVIAAGIIGRVLLGRPWIVVLESEDASGVGFAWKVPGWRQSARVIDEVVDAMQAGVEPEPREAAVRIALPRRVS
jgi:hypothetical protein